MDGQALETLLKGRRRPEMGRILSRVLDAIEERLLEGVPEEDLRRYHGILFRFLLVLFLLAVLLSASLLWGGGR